MTPDLDAIRQRLANGQRIANGDVVRLLNEVDRQQARIAALDALRPRIEAALHIVVSNRDKWPRSDNCADLLRDVLAALVSEEPT
jgi:hypothetical protein